MKKNIKKPMILMTALTLSLTLLSGCQGASKTPEAAAPSSEVKEEEKGTEQKLSNVTEVVAETEPEELVEETEKPVEGDDLYREMADWSFEFTSGAGAWATTMQVEPDGSFVGVYSDSDMGDTGEGYPDGTYYLSRFSGQFTGYKEVSPRIYEVTFGELVYENEPDTEEILDNMLTKYSRAYGLEDTDRLMVYLPGAPVEELPEEYLSWVSFMHFTAWVEEEVYEDLPKWLPFCGLYNPAAEDGFFSENRSTDNKDYLVNTASFPGFKNETAELNEDGTYCYEAVSEDGKARIVNLCFRDDGDHSIYSDEDGFAAYCVKELMKDKAPNEDDMYVCGTDDLEYGEGRKVYIDGSRCVQISWSEDNLETWWIARAAHRENYDLNATYDYVYAVSYNMEGMLTGEAADFLLRSLTFSGAPDQLGAVSENKAARQIEAMVTPGPGTTLLVDEVLRLGAGDPELLEKYGVDEDDITNDYVIVGNDNAFDEYPLADDCPIYLQYPKDYFLAPLTLEQFAEETDPDESRFMALFLDDEDRVVFAYEPYLP